MMGIDIKGSNNSIEGNVVLDSGGHGINAPASSNIVGNFIGNSGGNGINVETSVAEIEAMIAKLPNAKQGYFKSMLSDVLSGALGGLTVEGLKGYLAATLASL